MAQGTRGGWVRVAVAGLGAVLCVGTLGCAGTDKTAPPKYGSGTMPNTKQPTAGLPNTPTLPGANTGSRPNQPGYNSPYNGAGSGVQPAGGVQPGSGFGTAGAATPATYNQPNGLSNTPPTGRLPAQPGYNTNTGPASLVPNMSPSGYPPQGPAGYQGMGNPPPPAFSDFGGPIPPNPPGSGNVGSFAPPAGPMAPGMPGQGGQSGSK